MLKGTFLEGSQRLIQHRKCAYWGDQKTVVIQELARYATLLRSEQSGSVSPATTSPSAQTQGRLSVEVFNEIDMSW